MAMVREDLWFARCDGPGCPRVAYALAAPAREAAEENARDFRWEVRADGACYCPECRTREQCAPKEAPRA